MSHSVEVNPDKVTRKTRLPRIFGVIALGLGSTFAITTDAGANYVHSPTIALKSGIEPRLATDPCTPTITDFETEEGPSEVALKNLIRKIDNGGTVKVSAELIPLDGQNYANIKTKSIPAKGYPILIEIGGKACFAYAAITPEDQFGEVPVEHIAGNFNLSDVPAQYAHIPLQNASVVNHELVGADGLLVGWAMNKTSEKTVPGCSFQFCS